MRSVVDTRTWVSTDLPNERVAHGRAIDGVEVLSASDSTRRWTEVLHTTFTVAVIRRTPSPAGADWRTRGRTHRTLPGQLMAINAGDGHLTTQVLAPSSFDVVKLDPRWLDTAARGLGAPRPFRFARSSCESPAVYAATQRMVGALAEGGSPFELEVLCNELAVALVAELAEAPAPSQQRKDPVIDYRVRRVSKYLLEECGPKPSLENFERISGLAKSQLCLRFRQAYGMSMSTFWTVSRVAKARAMLLDGTAPSEIAPILGFYDESHLSKSFRRYHGVPPAAWAELFARNTRVLVDQRSERAIGAAPMSAEPVVPAKTAAKTGP